MTVNSLIDFFRPPSDVHLEQITSATLTKLEEFRDKTATGKLYIYTHAYTHWIHIVTAIIVWGAESSSITNAFFLLFCLGLVYVIETQKVLDLKINLMSSYVIVPQNGFYEATSNKLLLDLGHLKVTLSNSKKRCLYSMFMLFVL